MANFKRKILAGEDAMSEKEKQEDMIARFLAERNEPIEVVEDIKEEHSNYGGKTRSHLSYLQNAEDEGKYSFIKHKYDDKIYVVDGVKKKFQRSFSKRISKDRLVMRFHLTDGTILTEGSITKGINNGHIILLELSASNSEIESAMAATGQGYDIRHPNCYKFLLNIKEMSNKEIEINSIPLDFNDILLVKGLGKEKGIFIDTMMGDIDHYLIPLVKCAVSLSDAGIITHIFKNMDVECVDEVLIIIKHELRKSTSSVFLEEVNAKMLRYDEEYLEELLENNDPNTFLNDYKKGCLPLRARQRLALSAIEVGSVNALRVILEDSFIWDGSLFKNSIKKHNFNPLISLLLIAAGDIVLLPKEKVDIFENDLIPLMNFFASKYEDGGTTLAKANRFFRELGKGNAVACQNAVLKMESLISKAKQRESAERKDELFAKITSYNYYLVDSNGWSKLMHRVFEGDIDGVQMCLALGADINVKTKNNDTAMLKAIRGGHIGIVKSLIAAGGLNVSADEIRRLQDVVESLDNKYMSELIKKELMRS